jgi:hypothetical protein
MVKNTLRTTIFFLFLTIGLRSFSQTGTLPNSIQIQNNSIKEKELFYLASIYKADMEAYRLKNTDVTVDFSNGFQCVLYSAEKLRSKGILVDINSYKEKFDERFRLPLFSVCEDGQLTALYPKVFK